MEKKKSKPFTESDLTGKGYVETSPGVYEVRSQKGLNEIAAKIKSEYISTDKVAPIGPAVLFNEGGKYGVAKKSDRTFNGKVYDSKLEMQYRQHLDLLQKAGEVTRIIEQVQYPVDINQIHICNYNLDFKVTYKDGRNEFIDCKGMKTPVYRLKKKLVEAYYPTVKIKEIKSGDF